MKFTVERKVLIKMLKLVSLAGIGKDDRLRIAAQAGQLTLAVEDAAESSCDATVAEEGVCFFRCQQFRPLLRTYTHSKQLTIEVNAKELKFGSTTIGRGTWEISLFENPASAPRRLMLAQSTTVPDDKQGRLL